MIADREKNRRILIDAALVQRHNVLRACPNMPSSSPHTLSHKTAREGAQSRAPPSPVVRVVTVVPARC